MSELDELFTDLTGSPDACASGYEGRRVAGLNRKAAISERGRKKAAYQNASMPARDIGGIRKFSWETE